MFPGDGGLLPAFSSLSKATLDHIEDLEALLLRVEQSSGIKIGDWDCNDLLSEIKEVEAERANSFIAGLIDQYFSSAEVARALNSGSSALFPHYRQVQDINFDLFADLAPLQREIEAWKKE